METTKQVDLGDGCTFQIATLTYDQVEELLDTPVPDDPKGARERAWHEVMLSIHNCAGQEIITQADVKAKLQAAFPALQAVLKFNELRREVLAISGYKLEEKKPGEAVAAAAAN